MKKSLKKIITVVLTFAMMFTMTVPAYAKEAFKISVKENATIYSSKTMENRRCYNPDERIAYIGKRKVVVESSNTKVATVKIKDNAIWATQFIICVIPNIKIRVSHLNLIWKKVGNSEGEYRMQEVTGV